MTAVPTATPPTTTLIALIGNPNTGKSTLFNRLTGARQRVGNYPGVTVEKKTGEMTACTHRVTLIDLPGAYSLAANSPDERIATDVLTGRTGETPSLAVCLVAATHLRRGLFLACQLADLGAPLVIAVNFIDEAASKGLIVETKRLSENLGVPVVAISARKSTGLGELVLAIASAIETPRTLRLPEWTPGVHAAVALLKREVTPYLKRELRDAEYRRLIFESDSAHWQLINYPRKMQIPALEYARAVIRAEGTHPLATEALSHYKFLDRALQGVVHDNSDGRKCVTRTIDSLLTHRLFGLLLFAAVMFAIFQSIYSLAEPLMNRIEAITNWAGEIIHPFLAATPMFQSLVCDGVITGAGGVIVFLPQIFLLFFFVALLEDTGYMARAAFLMDKLFGWCGLNGKSFVPLLSSYACAVPGVLAARTIEDPKARLTTILIAPLMSCSARLPIYVLMIGAFIKPIYGSTVAAAALFAMHLLGLVVALPVAWVINRKILRTGSQPFLLEMPPYRLPSIYDVLRRMWQGGREFLKRAGTVIVALSVLIWALLYFPHLKPSEAPSKTGQELASMQLEESYLGRTGQLIQPVFAPAGFDWKITVGVLASFPAREVIVSTLGIIYRIGSDADEDSLGPELRNETWHSGPNAGRPVYTIPTALAAMVFFAFCMQCGSTLAVIAKEVGARWSLFAFGYMTSLAWLGAVLTYQAASRFL